MYKRKCICDKENFAADYEKGSGIKRPNGTSLPVKLYSATERVFQSTKVKMLIERMCKSSIISVILMLVHQVFSGKISAGLPGVLLSDYRFGLGDPYVMFYERDNYRGRVHFQKLAKRCKNLPTERQNWASSIDIQKRCVTVCDGVDCGGNCAKIYVPWGDPNNKGVSKLADYDMNDRIKSVKFCYPNM